VVRAEVAEKMSHVDALIEQAAQRSRGYWLLSRLFLDVPTAPRLSDLLGLLIDAERVSPSDEIAALRAEVAAALAHPDEAAAAFTRHLVLGDKENREPLPYEAHVLEGRLPGESTAQVHAAMQAAGYAEVAPEAPSPDHLGAELRFMALLCHEEHRAWQKDDAAAARQSLMRQGFFLQEHLQRWAPDYCRGLAARTASAYMRAVADLAATTIADDAAVVADIWTWVVPAELAETTAPQFESRTLQ
jgi:TorA maturation chaperone TorD